MGSGTPWSVRIAKLLLVFILLAVVGPPLFCVGFLAIRPSSAALVREIQQELPIGSGADQIEAWYRAKGITPTFLDGGRPYASDQDAHYQGIWEGYSDRKWDILVNVYVDDQRRAIRIHATETGSILLP
jgi:hypothetical protein